MRNLTQAHFRGATLALCLALGASLSGGCASHGSESSCGVVLRDNPTDLVDLVALVDQFHSAIREGDKEAYGAVFIDDFLFTWSRNGQLYDRATILPNVVPTPDFEPIVDEMLVRLEGDAAAVNFRVRQAPEEDGARVTFSCARVGGQWKVLASHSTKIVVEPDTSDASAE